MTDDRHTLKEVPAAMASPLAVRRPALILVSLALAQLIIALDYSIVFVALPDIGAGIGFPGQGLQWVIGAYAVTFGGFLLLGGRLCDLLGRRRLLLTGLALYALASAAGGLAGAPGVLVVARAVQGLGGAVLGPATLSLITTMFTEGPERNRALGVWGAAGSSGLVAGALLGGVLTQAFGWRSVFFVNVPLAAAVALLALRVVPAGPAAARRGGLDVPGAATATAGALLLVLGLVNGPQAGWADPVTVASFAAAAALIAAFAAIEACAAAPLVPLHVFRNRGLRFGALITFMFMATFGASAYFITLALQKVRGWDALSTGLAYILPCALVLAGTLIGGRMATAIGVRATLVTGLVTGAAGTALFAAFLGSGSTFGQMTPGIVVFSLAQGVVWTAMFSAATAGVPDQMQGLASGLATSGQQVGAAVGLAVLVAVASAVSGAHPSLTGFSAGLQAATYTSAGLILLTAGLALALPKR
jgi:MFS family permease